MNILITGGSGFLGRYLINELQTSSNYSIKIFNRSECDDLKSLGIDVICGNLLDKEAIKIATAGCDAVFHLAAKPGVWGSYKSYYNANVVATQNVVNACLENGVKYLIYTSSPSVIFNYSNLENVDEHTKYGNPQNMCNYAKTKMLAEKYILEQNAKKGLLTIALRPHLIYGPGDKYLIPNILQAARIGKLMQIGDGENIVDITYAGNAAYAHFLALKALQNHPNIVSGRAYFITDNNPINLWQWINNLLTKLNINKITKQISYKFAYTYGALFEFFSKILFVKKQPKITRFVSSELAHSHYFNISAAKQDLQYIPKYSPEESFNNLINWIYIKNL